MSADFLAPRQWHVGRMDADSGVGADFLAPRLWHIGRMDADSGVGAQLWKRVSHGVQ